MAGENTMEILKVEITQKFITHEKINSLFK